MTNKKTIKIFLYRLISIFSLIIISTNNLLSNSIAQTINRFDANENQLKQHAVFILLLTIVIILTIGIVLIYRSRQKKKILLQEMKNLADFKEQTANMIIHDLKGPIATLLNVELIGDEKIRLKMVKQASKRMMLLIENVLDVYKYENTEIKLQKQTFDMNSLIQESLEEFKLMTEIKKISIKIIAETNFEVSADLNLMSRVISNILSNSIKFSPRNDTIEINLEEKHKNLIVSFTNQGPGISKQQQQVIFNRFEQAQIRNFGKLPSTGLGLSFCQMAIKAHNGQIGVISDSDKGAKFWFSIPIC